MMQSAAPHLRPRHDVPRLMRSVLLALIPGTLAMVWLFGWGVLLNILLCGATALATEALMLRLRGRPIAPALGDHSALLAALLLALCLPPLLPWWMPVLGTFFALALGKHLYGGLGFNPFNPAMLGYVFLLVSFPGSMVLWPSPDLAPPGLLQTLAVGSGMTAFDMVSGATPLDGLKTALAAGQPVAAQRNGFGPFSLHQEPDWLLINALFLLGGLYLLRHRMVAWQIPLGVLLGLGLPAFAAWLIAPDQFADPLFHLFAGGAMLGAFFVATDPVSASTTPLGRLYYGLGIGILVWVIRSWGGYPEGVAFAVLLMNLAAPLLDRLCRPRIAGQG
ncbi:RnfABCDGE type electron transport complex subunit D [Methylonatrum kenyense]|uniref:RnfABCDGE type electron transport complex subunit D n=1 Tax=Methylonatrum kenyense TaxID=455253 RepID=UPI0020BE6B34|nr:RnfABCDGE type electron transport complex subunit D [Methylonatrum kenyense]MCK8514835.1 RnfABCDGE type electron transport complex subunit D [Methylonatrum kenyense]